MYLSIYLFEFLDILYIYIYIYIYTHLFIHRQESPARPAWASSNPARVVVGTLATSWALTGFRDLGFRGLGFIGFIGFRVWL